MYRKKSQALRNPTEEMFESYTPPSSREAFERLRQEAQRKKTLFWGVSIPTAAVGIAAALYLLRPRKSQG